MLRSVVIHPNRKTDDVGDLLAIARSIAQKKEHTHRNVNVKAVKFVPECNVYVAVYRIPGVREGQTRRE